MREIRGGTAPAPKAMSRPNLVIARVGRQSLHPAWLPDDGQRNWDLLLCPYQPLEGDPPEDHFISEVIPGPKWTGLAALLQDWPGWRAYDRVWLPDDDLLANSATLDRLFDVAERLEWDLCAPALDESSYYAHHTTMRNRSCAARRMGFVEIMAPCFSRHALEKLHTTFALSMTGWGWGLDSLWPKLLDYRNVGVIDVATVRHTRPVGAWRDAALERAVMDESDRIMEQHECRQVHTVFELIGEDLVPIPLSAAALTARLADGWGYLLERNPSVLPWLVEAQAPEGGWPAYPVAGRPAGGE